MSYNKYLKSQWWSSTKRYLKQIKKKRCYVCKFRKNIQVHHLHYRTVGYEDGSELVYLCSLHHKMVHFYTGVKEIPDSVEMEIKMRDRLEKMKDEFRLIKEVLSVEEDDLTKDFFATLS